MSDIKVGSWVYHINREECHKVTGIRGMYYDTDTIENTGHLGLSFCRLATPEEVKKHLIAESKKRYSVGVTVEKQGLNTGSKFGYTINHTEHSYYVGEDQLYVDGNLLIYQKGIWAEIIKEENKMSDKKITGYKCIKGYPGVTLGTVVNDTATTYQQHPEYWEPLYEEEKIMLGKWEVKFCSDCVLVGCVGYEHPYYIEDLKAIQRVLSKHNHYTQLWYGERDGQRDVQITEEIINKILKRLNAN